MNISRNEMFMKDLGRAINEPNLHDHPASVSAQMESLSKKENQAGPEEELSPSASDTMTEDEMANALYELEAREATKIACRNWAELEELLEPVLNGQVSLREAKKRLTNPEPHNWPVDSSIYRQVMLAVDNFWHDATETDRCKFISELQAFISEVPSRYKENRRMSEPAKQ